MSGQHCHPGRPGRSARARPVWQRKIGEPNRAPILQRAWPPVGGTFHFEMLVPAPLPKTCPKMVLSHKGGSLCVKTFLQKKFWRRERLPLSALAPARRAAAVSEPKPPPCPITVRAHHGARPCWRKSTC